MSKIVNSSNEKIIFILIGKLWAYLDIFTYFLSFFRYDLLVSKNVSVEVGSDNISVTIFSCYTDRLCCKDNKKVVNKGPRFC